MNPTNEELNLLQRKKHALVRQLNRHDINELQYDEQVKPIQDEINLKVRQILNSNDEHLRQERNDKENKSSEVKEKMVDEKVETKETKEASDKPVSYTRLIIKALGMKGLKDIDAVVDKVLELRPGRDRAKTKTQALTIIGLVKKQVPKRWTKYEWNQEEFLLVEKVA